MNLFGLNDLNMTMEEFIAKSSDIAAKKVRNDALLHATQLEREKFGATGLINQFENTDSGTYQAIKMADDWDEHLYDEVLKKQIHQAFKLATVYYKPSPVLYRGQ